MTKSHSFQDIRFNLATDDDYMNAFRTNVQKYLSVVSIRQLSEDADVPLETLKSFLYGGTGDCKLGFAIKLAKALGCSIDELVGADTIDADAKVSMCMLDKLPPQFLKFIRWAIRDNYKRTLSEPMPKGITVMTPDWDDNMIATSLFEKVSVNAPSSVVAKSFLGIRIPCDEFIPHYFKDDVICIANDRRPKHGEHIVVHIDNSFWIMKSDGRNHLTLNDGRINNNGEYIGYICHVERNRDA